MKKLLSAVIIFFAFGTIFSQDLEPTAQLDVNIYENSERYDEAMDLLDQDKVTQALAILDDLAQKGDFQSKYTAGRCYFFGFAGTRNYEKVWEYLPESAEYGAADSIYILNLCLMYGLGCEKDPETAMPVLKKMENIQSSLAQLSYVMAEILLSGDGCDVDLEEAYKYLTIAADNNIADACYDLGNYYYFGYLGEENISEAQKYYKKGTMLGNGLCAVQMGLFYSNGIGVEQNFEMAYNCFELSAKTGNMEGMNDAAYCLANGIGCELSSENADKATIYWGLLEVQNYGPGIYQFGYQYTLGTPYFKSDKKRAVQLFKKAMELGEEKAKELYEFYSQDYPKIIKYFEDNKQYENAIIWITEMADSGDVEAMENAGHWYYIGDKIPKDYEKSQYYYFMAANKNSASACYTLGTCYLVGSDGLPVDDVESFKWLSRAAELNYQYAWSDLGYSYMNGYGTEINYEMAFKCFEKAIEMDDSCGSLYEAEMYENGYYVEKDLRKAYELYKSVQHIFKRAKEKVEELEPSL